jgi:hypothetical protein
MQAAERPVKITVPAIFPLVFKNSLRVVSLVFSVISKSLLSVKLYVRLLLSFPRKWGFGSSLHLSLNYAAMVGSDKALLLQGVIRHCILEEEL